MYVLGTGIFLWILAVLALIRTVHIARRGRHAPRLHFLLWLFVLSGAAALLLRPHEDIFGGQDQGSYLNSAVTYAREGSLSHEDPLLSQVPADVRTDFQYHGRKGEVPTKLHVLRLEDADSAEMVPWFQPAYPILMSVVAKLGNDRLILYVAPLFAILTGIALATIAGQLFHHKYARLAAFALYILNPVTAWHGRCARSELVASYFVFAGLALLINGWRSRKSYVWLDMVLGAICVSASPFFHITSWLVAVPLAVVAGLIIVSGRIEFLVYPFAAVGGLAIFIYQTIVVVDPYGLKGVLGCPLGHPIACLVVLNVGLVLLVTACLAVRKWKNKRPDVVEALVARADGIVPRVGVAFAVIVCVSLLLANFLPGVQGAGIRSPGTAMTQLRVTEMKPFVTVVSPVIAVLGLIGWIVLLVRKGDTQSRRLLFAFIMLPALMLVGRMPIYMYFLRRSVPFLVPVLAISLASLVSLLPAVKSAGGHSLAGAVVCVIALVGARGRTQLYRTVNYRGFTEFIGNCAEEIREEDGILLCEYSRIAASFGHFCGVPTLGIDNERIHDYSRIEEAWEGIMRAEFGTPVFFATPFDREPVSDRFEFELVGEHEYSGERLHEQKGGVPQATSSWGCNLKIYRMQLLASQEEAAAVFPYVYRFDAGNMGLRRFAKRYPKSDIEVKGTPLAGNRRTTVSLSSGPSARKSDDLFLFFLDFPDSADVLEVKIEAPGVAESHQPLSLVDDWWVSRVSCDRAGSVKELSITPSRGVLLVSIQSAGEGGELRSADSFTGGTLLTKKLNPFVARRARQDSQFLIPLPARNEGHVLMLMYGELVPGKLALADAGSEARTGMLREVSAGKWQWVVWPLAGMSDTERAIWGTIRAVDADDPDVSLLMAYGCVLPLNSQEDSSTTHVQRPETGD